MHLHSALVVVSSATSPSDLPCHSGKISSYGKQPPPPKYISPPPVQYNGPSSAPAGYWTVPHRRAQDDGRTASSMQQNGRYNTIASANSWNRPAQSGYNHSSPSGAYPPPPSYRSSREGGPKYTTPMPASIPIVPRSNRMQSSTPTKADGNVMDMSLYLSPIAKTEHRQQVVRSPHVPYPQQNAIASSPSRLAQGESRKQRLLSPPKSSMTSEELFAAIHRSKKKLNIKTDTDSYSRSASPSCSSMTSLSPGSSESSINGSRNGKPETGTLGIENVSRNRHSWSPNSKELLDNRGYLERHTPSPVPPAGSRQSWACDRLGPVQQTSMNDFKRLLLQHGSKTSPSSAPGLSAGRMSAAEQLRLSRQQKLTPPPPPSIPVVNGIYSPRSPAEKRTNGSKLLHSPRTLATWRFASPRTDVLSSTILEDRAEEEKAANSPTQETSPQPQMTTPISRAQALINSAVRRPLNLSFSDGGKDSPTRNDVAAILQQYRKDSSPKARGELNRNHVNRDQTCSERIILPNNKVMSPSSAKENINTNNSPSRLTNNLSASQLANYKARQLFLQQSSALSSQQPSSPRIHVTFDKQQKTNFYNAHGSPGRSILASIETKSPSKSTLETAL